MAETNQLNHAWLASLANPHHDGTTQQIDDFVAAFTTDNQVFNQKKAVIHQARLKEDEVWLKSQRDAAVPLLEAADKKQDSYITATRYIINAHAGLPEDEATKTEAQQCAQVFKDYNFRTDDAYGAESDKIIQMQQNMQAHQTFLTNIGAWTFFTKAVEQAQLVRQYLGQRAQTKGEFVKGEMKSARKATDQAIADLYKTITAMMELIPSAELSALYTKLKGIEIYARQYYLGDGSAVGSGGGTSTNTSQGGESNGSGSSSGSGGTGGSGGASPSPSEGGGTEQGGSSGSGDSGSSSGTGGSSSVAAPTISGETPFDNSTQVTITAAEGASIKYTTNGIAPTLTYGNDYEEPITLNASATVKAVAIIDGVASEVATKAFVKNGSQGGSGEEGM